MTVAFYFDHNMPRPLALALRQRGIDVLLSAEDGTESLSDPDLWERAESLDRIVATQYQDFLALAQMKSDDEQPHPGLVFCHTSNVPLRQLADDLELIAQAMSLDELISTIFWVPM